MENNELKSLIETFKGYRDLLSPVQENLHDFVETYDSMKNEIEKLNTAFEGNVQANLENIYKTLSKQAEHATDLSSRINQFMEMSGKYTGNITRLIALFEKAGVSLEAVNALESRAEEQISKLDAILEEKKKNYNIKELQKTLENYNANVERVSEFINKNVADTLSQNYKKLETIKSGNELIAKKLEEENSSVEKLLTSTVSTNDILKRVVEKQDVNEAYIFDILDKWAEVRRVKTKK